MAKTFLTSINLAGNELMNASVHNLATAPANPKIGQIYFNTGSNIPYFWDGDNWTMFGHTTAEINTIVRGTALKGYTVGANSALVATDTILGAFGKVQGQIDAIPRGTVTSVGISVPTGLSVSNSPITSSGVIAIGLHTDYSIPTTAKQGEWDTAYSHSQTEHQSIIDGTGFVKANGKTLSYDNSSYSLSTHDHSGTYEPVLGSPVTNGYLLSSTTGGTRSWVAPYSLPIASSSVLGGVKIGTNVTIKSGVISVHNPVTIGTANGLSLSTQTLSLALATTSASGALSATDKTYIDLLKTFFEYDSANNAIKALKSLYSTGELSAYGLGEGGGSGGGSMDMMQGWTFTTATENYYLPAKLAVPFYNDTRSRLTTLEGGSATTVRTTGTGNAITSVSKTDNEITFNKATKFAELGADNKILTSQLPSYVDDVLEFASLAKFPTTGESGKIYVTLDTNKTYRWTGSAYIEISASIALGETSSTAYRGDRGKIAYDHSQVEHQAIIDGTGFVKANGKTLSYDNSSYSLSSHNHNSDYQPLHTGLTNIATQSANATLGLLKKTAANTWTFDDNSYSLSNHTHEGVYEPVFTKKTAFNKNFGTEKGTVTQGNDSRLFNSRTPTKKTGVIGTGFTTVVTHGLGSADIIASVMTTAGEVVECDIINTATTTTFRFNVKPAASTYKYVIIG